MEIKIINLDGKLNKENFSVDKEIDLGSVNVNNVVRYIRVFQLNNRQGTSNVKTRSTIRGGGKKPWKQKGTGNARAGSNKSPLWRGGSIIFGPEPRNWELSLNRKFKANVFKTVVGDKINNDNLMAFESEGWDKSSTKIATNIISENSFDGKVLVIHDNDNVMRSFRNIHKATVRNIGEVNVFDIISNDHVIIEKSILDKFINKIS